MSWVHSWGEAFARICGEFSIAGLPHMSEAARAFADRARNPDGRPIKVEPSPLPLRSPEAPRDNAAEIAKLVALLAEGGAQ
jgi:hypothetical protein